MKTEDIKSDITEDVLSIASDIEFDALLENRYTANTTIRFVCAVRKALLECAPEALTPEMALSEQLINRLYDRLGHERRGVAYADQTYKP